MSLTAAHAQTRPTALQAEAELAVVEGRPADAVALTDAILADDPQSYPGLFIKALALSDLEQYEEAAGLADAAYQVAATDAERLQAARLAGTTRFRAGQLIRAEWWLRRASNHVKTQEEAVGVYEAFQAVRRANPVSVNLNFGIAPTSNFNGGSDSNFILFEGLGTLELPPDQQALSGIEYRADLRLDYRLSRTDQQQTSFGLFLYGRTYTPSSSAREKVPGIDGDDYSLSLGEVSLTQSRLMFPDVGISSGTVHFGRLYYGGDPFWNYGKLSLSQTFGLENDDAILVQVTGEQQNAIDASQADTRIYNLAVGYLGTRENNDTYQISINKQIYDTEAFESSFEDYRVRLNYTFARATFGVSWETSIGVGYTNYDVYFAALDGRQDNYVFGTGSATWTDFSYFGFSPRVDLTAQRRVSNVGQFTSSSLQLRVGLESNF